MERRTKLKKGRKTSANALRTRFALYAKYHVPLAWLIKSLLCRLVPSGPPASRFPIGHLSFAFVCKLGLLLFKPVIGITKFTYERKNENDSVL